MPIVNAVFIATAVIASQNVPPQSSTDAIRREVAVYRLRKLISIDLFRDSVMPSGAKPSVARRISPGVRGVLEIIERTRTEGRGLGVGAKRGNSTSRRSDGF